MGSLLSRERQGSHRHAALRKRILERLTVGAIQNLWLEDRAECTGVG